MDRNRNGSSIDGFVPRRPGSQVGGLRRISNPAKQVRPIDRTLHTGSKPSAEIVGQPRPNRTIGRSSIDESLRAIDEATPVKKLSRKERKQNKLNARQRRYKKAKRTLKFATAIIVLAIVGVGGFMGYHVLHASGNMFQGSIADIVKTQPLKQDENGFSNFLILGTSEDDPGHEAGNLTDSMMVLSVNQTSKQAYMFSIPRDLWVDYGQACASGYSGKINVFFSCSNEGTDKASEQDRLKQTEAFVGDIFGLDIQYGIHVNNTVIKDAVNAVGGVDVNIQGDGADGILDRNFDWRCKYKCYLVKYDNGVHHLDGDHALYLSMARGDTAPTYGLANSNFDREKNQQKIILALKQKAISTGTLSNISAVTKLIDTMGDNLRTNIQTSEIRTLMGLASDIPSANIHQLSFYGGDVNLVQTANENGQSVVEPNAGTYDYSEIQDYIAQKMNPNPVVGEAANVAVYNGSDTAGAAQTIADKITAQKMTVTTIDNAPDGDYAPVAIYQFTNEDTATAAALKKIFGVTPKQTDTPPFDVPAGTDFMVVVGPGGVKTSE